MNETASGNFYRGAAEDAEMKTGMNELTEAVIGACIEVHRTIGPGLLESAYEQCLCRELSLRDIPFACQLQLPLNYKGMLLDCGYRVDLLVDNRLLLEIKSVERILPIHEAQLLSYLRLGNWQVGLLINFNVAILKDGITRRVNNFKNTIFSTSSAPPR